jgi:hypothetical protein
MTLLTANNSRQAPERINYSGDKVHVLFAYFHGDGTYRESFFQYTYYADGPFNLLCSGRLWVKFLPGVIVEFLFTMGIRAISSVCCW